MLVNQELLDAIEASEYATAKRHVLNDLCVFYEKYIRKLNNQLKDATRKYEKVKKHDDADMEYFRVMTQREQLQCQMIEALKLQQEMLKRSIKAGEDVIEARDHLKEVKERWEQQVANRTA